ncbi:uroporphyrinogen-III C-methyltransferase [Legionella clemsonensis]|uniref:Uroporphyrinogen-III C-methyltransferase n=1 Tax=Legionella clemsonensis TaxID=1867846 RepID=A0A222NZP9_9GAMM|nr:uroporphyrinogen-III C-methyltransferase [Legionella clemsonensis]ASQ45049.1 Putative uroporphyrinogen-III C-methyltransferase [Legionella clemsonensis]
MANNKEEQTKKLSSKPHLDNTRKTTTSKAETVSIINSPKLSLGIVLLAVLLALIALIFAIYSLHMNKQSVMKAEKETHSLTAEFNRLKQQQMQAQSLTTSVETLTKAQTELQRQLQAIDQELRTAMQQRLYQREDWNLLKARYYLELAQINAHWSNDQQTSIALLKQADALLSSLSEQPVFTVRQAIAQEITQLQATPRVDIAGLLSQLDAAERNLSNLPLKQPLGKTQNKAEAKKKTSWREHLQQSLNSLGDLIVIRRHDEAIEPLLSPLQQSLLEEVIRLNLAEAQWALLHNNPKVYQIALTKSINTIKRAFDEKAPATQTIIHQLETLQQQKLDVAKPTLDKALPLLNQLIENKSRELSTPALKEGELSQ